MTGFRSGAARFGPSVVVVPPAGRNAQFFRRGFNRPVGNFRSGYFPYLGAYPFIGDNGLAYTPPAGYVAVNDTVIAQPSPQSMSPPPPSQSAHSVINEYTWNEPAAALDDLVTTFTIMLKDGSKRYAVAVWIQAGNLHYVDSQGRQQVLSSDLIDRDTTQRLNRQKNLKLQLPPVSMSPLVNPPIIALPSA
jgi:hypothetical protein